MSTDDEFIQTIIANPDDDTPRLVYADWLDEQGDPRGEFIRVQCALATMADEDPGRWDLELRQARLLRRYGWQWWFEPFNPLRTRPNFTRGFAETASLDIHVRQFLAQPQFFFRNYPFLQNLMLYDVEEQHVPSLLELDNLERLKALHIADGFLVSRPFRALAQKIKRALRPRFGDRVK
jgi:uncharacterized protein (TIGR02996 family)